MNHAFPRRPRLRVPAAFRSAALSLAVAAVVTVHGRVIDTTTGQPLVDVGIDVFKGPSASGKRLLHVSTAGDGTFALRGLHGGTYSIALSSDDVPRAEETIRVDPAHPHDVLFQACSTTLDYSCAPKFDVPKNGTNSGG